MAINNQKEAFCKETMNMVTFRFMMVDCYRECISFIGNCTLSVFMKSSCFETLVVKKYDS